MNFDLRLPLGLIFGFYGLVLVVYGLITQGSVAYDRSLGLNVNLIWGAVLLVFAALMLVGALRGRKSLQCKCDKGKANYEKVG
jgi:hypothetical protein